MLFENTRVKGFRYVKGSTLDDEQRSTAECLWNRYYDETGSSTDDYSFWQTVNYMTMVLVEKEPVAFLDGISSDQKLYVAREYRRLGIGRSLLYEALNAAHATRQLTDTITKPSYYPLCMLLKIEFLTGKINVQLHTNSHRDVEAHITFNKNGGVSAFQDFSHERFESFVAHKLSVGMTNPPVP